MKFLRLKYYAIALLLCFITIKSTAQEMPKGYKINIEMTTDEKGDALVDVTIKYNAQNWDAVKQTHGADASVLKNIWRKEFPKYELTDFDIKTDDGERTSMSKFKILGMLKVDEDGKWIAALDQKSPDITKISDNQFLLVDESTAQTLKITLPKSASNAKVEKDSFGKAILTYTAPVSGGGAGNIIKYLGFLVAAGGVFLFFKNRGMINTVLVKNAAPKKIDYHQTKNIDDAVVINTPAPAPTPSKEQIRPAGNDLENAHE